MYAGVYARKVHVSHVMLTPGGLDSLGIYGSSVVLVLSAKGQRLIPRYVSRDKSWEESCLRDSSIQY